MADFLILEAEDKPVAAAAGYVPDPEDYCPLRLSRLEAIAHELKWSRENLTVFRDRYLALWGGDLRPFFLTLFPHIGIANSQNAQACKDLVDDLNAAPFEVRGRVEKLDVIWYEDNQVNTIKQISLM